MTTLEGGAYLGASCDLLLFFNNRQNVKEGSTLFSTTNVREHFVLLVTSLFWDMPSGKTFVVHCVLMDTGVYGEITDTRRREVC